MRMSGIIVSGFLFVAISGCTAPDDDYKKLSAQLANSQQLVKQANEAHLKIAAENRTLKTTLRETQAKLTPTQKKLNEVEKQLLASQNAYKKDVAELTKKNESLQTELENSAQDTKKIKNQLKGCQSDLVKINKKLAAQQSIIARQNLIIQNLRKSNADVKKSTASKLQH